MRTQISYWRIAFAAVLLTALIVTGGLLKLKQSHATVGTVTLAVDAANVPLGGRAIFTGSIPTGSTATIFTSVTINLAPTTSQELGLPSVSLTVDCSQVSVSR